MRRRAGALCASSLLLGTAGALEAQISPGPLSRAHAGLEGAARCLDCHEASRGVAPGKCLACHQALGERIAAGRGLHARAEYRECRRCHLEHHGVEHELVWWGKAGREGFAHRQTGHALEGKHATLACPACHQPRYQRPEATAREGTNPARTYLGLGTACTSCHADEHRGQFQGRGCASCHGQTAWKPASGFDHARTGYPLVGRHAAVSCGQCHRSVAADASGSYRRFARLASRECVSCHPDAHRGRLGPSCASCHSPSGWRGALQARFDHERTGYALRGRHASVACEACHRPGHPLRLAHERCTDCHADAHLGQLARRADKGRCESCHDVSGFSPARFSVEDHGKTGFALAGAHLAVACNVCHRPLGRAALAKAIVLRLAPEPRPARSVPLRFASTRCTECHRDPHHGEVDRFLRAGGCEACHGVESWQPTAFDHGKTRFPLARGHARLLCSACHAKVEAGTPRERVRIAGLAVTCEACHRDPHPGQFVRTTASWACERCHTAESWKSVRFDHARETAYVLDGAHARIACSACHTRERAGAGVSRRPLSTACRDCHVGSPR